jgi:hypothetical protein
MEIDKSSYEVIFKFSTMTSMSLFMLEFDQFRKKQEKKKQTRNRLFRYKTKKSPTQQCVDRILKKIEEERPLL